MIKLKGVNGDELVLEFGEPCTEMKKDGITLVPFHCVFRSSNLDICAESKVHGTLYDLLDLNPLKDLLDGDSGCSFEFNELGVVFTIAEHQLGDGPRSGFIVVGSIGNCHPIIQESIKEFPNRLLLNDNESLTKVSFGFLVEYDNLKAFYKELDCAVYNLEKFMC